MPGLTRNKLPARRALDFQVARERLSRLAANDSTPDFAARERILHERALTLARPQAAQENVVTATLEVLSIRLGRENYAIESQFLRRVLVPGDLTRLPGAPAILRGVTNLGGDILPVFDLRELLEAERTPPSDDARWLLLGNLEPELCVWADAVFELRCVDPNALGEPDRSGRAHHEFVRGVTRDAQSILDARQLLENCQLYIGEPASVRQGGVS